MAATAVALLGGTGIAVAATSAGTPASQFAVVNGDIRAATGTPMPASGTEAALFANESYATTTIDGSGRVLVGAVGDNCAGWPTISVSVDGKHVGDTTVVSHTNYGTYGIGPAGDADQPDGHHQVKIAFINDHTEGGSCDRNVALGYARMEHPSGTSPTASPSPTTTVNGFVHPGVSVNKSRLDLIKAKVVAGQEPWKSAYAKLLSQSISGQKYSSLTYVAKPVDILKCATAGGRAYIEAHPEMPELKEQGCAEQSADAIAALTDALIWYVTGNPAYAQKSIEIMNAWSGTLKQIWFADPHKPDGTFIYGNGKLQAAWTAETITRAAEIIRYTYTPAAGQPTFNVARFSSMLTNVMLPLTIDNWTGGVANWMLSTTDATIAIGVFTNDRSVFDNGIGDWRRQVPSAFYLSTDKPTQPQLAGSPIPPPGTIFDKPTTTAATMKTYWNGPSSYPNGLEGETCRDLGHTVMGIEGMSSAAETARIQGIDLWGEQQHRIVTSIELNASYVNSAVAGNLNPPNWVCPNPINFAASGNALGWEAVYNHYANRVGLSMPQTKAVVARDRPSGSGLHMTAATLLYGDVL